MKNSCTAKPKSTKFHFPRGHLFVASALATCLSALALFPSNEAAAKRHEQNLDLQFSPIEQQEQEPTAPANETISWQTLNIKNGDNLAKVFQRAGASSKDLYKLLHSSKEAKQLTKIHPGRQLAFHINEQGQLQQLRYQVDILTTRNFTRTDNSFSFSEEQRQPDIHQTYRQATINNSLFLAGQRAKMEDSLIMELANIFGWDIDFGLDIRRGDNFSLVYEEKYLDGEKIGNGAILAAEFTNQGQTYRAVRYQDTRGNTHYYTPTGKSMRKDFLRAPLDFRRISSNFNPRRLHPIHKTVRPHRGTDYAASRGTPVWSSGDGKVILSTYNRASGNYVVIQHGNNIKTKYLHLTKRNVRKGQRVKQRQVIGTVGSTGYSTAPHLHYEFLVNGVHRNPRTILKKLPQAPAISKQELARFQSSIQPTLAVLAQYQRSTQLASASPVR